MIKVNIKHFLSLCLIAISCSSAGSGGEDKFMQINFNSSYADIIANSAKRFSFTVAPTVPGVPTSDAGSDCVAVTWEGRLNKNDYYGFAVGKDDFHLILYFLKQDAVSGTTLNPAPSGLAPSQGEYVAVMRYGNTIYKNPQNSTSITLTFTPNGNLTEIVMTGSIIFELPTTATVTQSSPPMILRPY